MYICTSSITFSVACYVYKKLAETGPLWNLLYVLLTFDESVDTCSTLRSTEVESVMKFKAAKYEIIIYMLDSMATWKFELIIRKISHSKHVG